MRHQRWDALPRPTMQAIKAEIFEVRSDMIKWIANMPTPARKQAKLVIVNLAIASREADSAQPSMAGLLIDQVKELRALLAQTRWYRLR